MAQGDLILAALLSGRALTKLDAFKMGAGLSINSRIADLRKQGYDIRCEVVTREGRRVWEYRLVIPPNSGEYQIPLLPAGFAEAAREALGFTSQKATTPSEEGAVAGA